MPKYGPHVAVPKRQGSRLRETNRRLAKDFEATTAPARAFLYAASVMLLVRRLA